MMDRKLITDKDILKGKNDMNDIVVSLVDFQMQNNMGWAKTKCSLIATKVIKRNCRLSSVKYSFCSLEDVSH